tara:strand:- start:27 stop:821 length:795 start_codon:yes stop_codon:yes gene_type:complete
MSAPFGNKNGFELHGIRHVSSSSINLWESNPALWIAQYLLKLKRPPSAAMWRGIVVEDAVVGALTMFGGKGAVRDLKFHIRAALKKFDTEIVIADEKTTRERDAIEPMVELALKELKKYGEPEFSVDGAQQKVEINCHGDGWKLPIIGYLDLVYPRHGLVVDLKTTMRMPSSMMASHRRQRCIYQRCMGNQQVKFLYVTPKKSGWLEDGDVDEELAKIKSQMNRLERFLKLSDDPKFLASIIPVDPTHFYWSDCIDHRKEIFGI